MFLDVSCGIFFVCFFWVFFFKQKTAYEMRISDWSSDVCSSDLPVGGLDDLEVVLDDQHGVALVDQCLQHLQQLLHVVEVEAGGRLVENVERAARRPPRQRSEEHTSELQSLMRISYAVFCLKKKTTKHYCRNITRLDIMKVD